MQTTSDGTKVYFDGIDRQIKEIIRRVRQEFLDRVPGPDWIMELKSIYHPTDTIKHIKVKVMFREDDKRLGNIRTVLSEADVILSDNPNPAEIVVLIMEDAIKAHLKIFGNK